MKGMNTTHCSITNNNIHGLEYLWPAELLAWVVYQEMSAGLEMAGYLVVSVAIRQLTYTYKCVTTEEAPSRRIPPSKTVYRRLSETPRLLAGARRLMTASLFRAGILAQQEVRQRVLVFVPTCSSFREYAMLTRDVFRRLYNVCAKERTGGPIKPH